MVRAIDDRSFLIVGLVAGWVYGWLIFVAILINAINAAELMQRTSVCGCGGLLRN